MIRKSRGHYQAILTLATIALGAGCSIYPAKEGSRPASAKEIVIQNLKKPLFWIPVAGAAGLAVAKQDKKVSAWAMKRTPVFSSKENADDASSDLNSFLKWEAYLSTIFTSYGAYMDSEAQFAVSKLYQTGVVYIAQEQSEELTQFLKTEIKKERPNDFDFKDFPSGHATAAGSASAVANKNIASFLGNRTGAWIGAANNVAASAVVWARIESGYHYPSSALAGYALGYFTSSLVYDFLFGLNPNRLFALDLDKNQKSLRYILRF